MRILVSEVRKNLITIVISDNKQIFGAAKILQLEEAEQAAKLMAAEAEAAKKSCRREDQKFPC